MQLKRGQLVKNTGTKTLRLAIVTRIWQSKPTFSPQVEVLWMYYPARPEMVGTTTQIDSRRFGTERVWTLHSSGYVIVQDETGQPAAPLR